MRSANNAKINYLSTLQYDYTWRCWTFITLGKYQCMKKIFTFRVIKVFANSFKTFSLIVFVWIVSRYTLVGVVLGYSCQFIAPLLLKVHIRSKYSFTNTLYKSIFNKVIYIVCNINLIKYVKKICVTKYYLWN